MSLVKVLFEDFGFSRFTDESQGENDSWDLNATLFNKSNKLTKGYEFEKYIRRDSSMNEEEVLFFDLQESWCPFYIDQYTNCDWHF